MDEKGSYSDYRNRRQSTQESKNQNVPRSVSSAIDVDAVKAYADDEDNGAGSLKSSWDELMKGIDFKSAEAKDVYVDNTEPSSATVTAKQRGAAAADNYDDESDAGSDFKQSSMSDSFELSAADLEVWSLFSSIYTSPVTVTSWALMSIYRSIDAN